MRVLSGDIGGTHSRLAIARVEGQRVELERVGRYRNAEHPGLEAILAAFLDGEDRCDACCLAVAGPRTGDGSASPTWTGRWMPRPWRPASVFPRRC
jgi:glucokinase